MKDCIVVKVTKFHRVDLTIAVVQLACVPVVLRTRTFCFVFVLLPAFRYLFLLGGFLNHFLLEFSDTPVFPTLYCALCLLMVFGEVSSSAFLSLVLQGFP